MPAIPPPNVVINISVPQISSTTWTFQSNTAGLITPQGAIDLDASPDTKGVSPLYMEFDLQPGQGITASFTAGQTQPPSIIIWNQKDNGTDCASPDKTVPDKLQDEKIYSISSTKIEVKYGNHKGNNGKVSLKCNFYSLNLNVGDASHPPSVQNLDPIITNGDGSVGCTDHHGNFLPCRRTRRHRRAVHP